MHEVQTNYTHTYPVSMVLVFTVLKALHAQATRWVRLTVSADN